MTFRNCFRPVTNLASAIAVLTCSVAGLLFSFQHKPLGALIEFAFVAANIAIAKRALAARRALDAVQAQIARMREEDARRESMTHEDRILADEKARINLEKIVRATGAHFVLGDIPGYYYGSTGVQIDVAGQRFLLFSGHIFRVDLIGFTHTCYHGNAREPADENIASALLLLKQNPGVFEKWCRQDGFYLD